MVLSDSKTPFLVVGDYTIKHFGKRIKEKFSDNSQIIFLGSIYNNYELNVLRFFCNFYFHGHSVGGTNPSLLEAMGSSNFIIAHNNIFNKAVLKENAYYFYTPEDVSFYLKNKNKKLEEGKIQRNLEKISKEYDINKINGSYLSYFYECLQKNKSQ